MRSRSVHAAVWLVVAAAAAGCSSSQFSFFTADAGPAAKAPTVQITHADEVALNEAVTAIAKADTPRQYEEASAKLSALYQRFEAGGATNELAETIFWSAYCREKTGRKDEAAQFYKRIIDEYPQTRAADEAKLRRSRLEFKRPAE